MAVTRFDLPYPKTPCCAQTSRLYVWQNGSYCQSKFYTAGQTDIHIDTQTDRLDQNYIPPLRGWSITVTCAMIITWTANFIAWSTNEIKSRRMPCEPDSKPIRVRIQSMSDAPEVGPLVHWVWFIYASVVVYQYAYATRPNESWTRRVITMMYIAACLASIMYAYSIPHSILKYTTNKRDSNPVHQVLNTNVISTQVSNVCIAVSGGQTSSIFRLRPKNHSIGLQTAENRGVQRRILGFGKGCIGCSSVKISWHCRWVKFWNMTLQHAHFCAL